MAVYDENADLLLNETQNEPVLTREEEVALFKRYESGDDAAREEIIRANFRFVAKISHEFLNRGLPMSDLLQEGVVGLLEVIPKFDWRRGHRFATYASYWIRQSITMALRRHCAMIRLPVRKSRAIGRMNELMRRFRLENGREPTAEELADSLDLSREEVDRLMKLREGVLSLEASHDDDGVRLIDLVACPDAVCPREAAERSQLKAKIESVFEYLGERERKVLRLRFGFENGKALSLRRTSKIVGLSQEGVRRIEQRALDKLRRPAISQMVAGLV